MFNLNMELTKLSQDQLVCLINKATALLEYDRYEQTHLYINAKNSEPCILFDAAK